MRDDLTKAENRWRNRSLFRRERRPWLRILFLLLVAGVLVLSLSLMPEGPLPAWLEQLNALQGG